MNGPGTPLLRVERLTASWGRVPVIRGLDLAVGPGEVVALLGRNGTGKTTTLRAIMGTGPVVGGSVRMAGGELAGLPAFRIARAGIAWVPEGRRVFGGLSVAENLEAGRAPARPPLEPWSQARVLRLFPSLETLLRRPAARISGGEQQMLAIGRALMGNPAVLLLDEPAEGLAPRVAQAVAQAIRTLQGEGVGIVLAEAGTELAGSVARTALVLEDGRAGWQGETQELLTDQGLRARLLGVSG